MVSRAYSHLAPFYDALSREDVSGWVSYLESLWHRLGVLPQSILELGCGTGNVTIPLAKKGYALTGVDIARPMLEEAKKKAEGMEIEFYEQDFTLLEIPQVFDLCLSVCDGFNYVLERSKLKEALLRINRHLKLGGLLLFDVNSLVKLEEVYGNNTFAEINSDLGLFWTNSFDPSTQICTMHLTFFTRQDDGLFERTREEHKQRFWSEQELWDALGETGFDCVGFFEVLGYEEPLEDSERWQFVARKVEEVE